MLSVVPTAATGEWKLAQADSLRMDIMAVQSGNVFYGLTKYISEAELPVEYLKMNPACFFFSHLLDATRWKYLYLCANQNSEGPPVYEWEKGPNRILQLLDANQLVSVIAFQHYFRF
jgi:hypothetical protein